MIDVSVVQFPAHHMVHNIDLLMLLLFRSYRHCDMVMWNYFSTMQLIAIQSHATSHIPTFIRGAHQYCNLAPPLPPHRTLSIVLLMYQYLWCTVIQYNTLGCGWWRCFVPCGWWQCGVGADWDRTQVCILSLCIVMVTWYMLVVVEHDNDVWLVSYNVAIAVGEEGC